jgi:FlaA1/EpsC-like NDP-sugar epimerase
VLINKKIIIFGVGISVRLIYRKLNTDSYDDVIGFIDNDKALHRTFKNGMPIFNPKISNSHHHL